MGLPMDMNEDNEVLRSDCRQPDKQVECTVTPHDSALRNREREEVLSWEGANDIHYLHPL